MRQLQERLATAEIPQTRSEFEKSPLELAQEGVDGWVGHSAEGVGCVLCLRALSVEKGDWLRCVGRVRVRERASARARARERSRFQEHVRNTLGVRIAESAGCRRCWALSAMPWSTPGAATLADPPLYIYILYINNNDINNNNSSTQRGPSAQAL